jgi:hypothetical protein
MIEVIVAMFVTLMVMMAGMAIFVGALQQSAFDQAQSTAYSVARSAIAEMDQYIKQAESVPDSVTINGVTYAPTATVLVLLLPSWDDAEAKTISGKQDKVVFQFVSTQTDSNGSSHKAYNVYEIVSPDETSSRQATARWLFPYDSKLDSSDSTKNRSDPYVQPWKSGSTDVMFRYFVQSGTSGDVAEKTSSDGYDKVLMVEAEMTVRKTYQNTTIDCNVSTQSRLRNWTAPS